MTLLLPPPLEPGDAIGVFSPSAAATAWAPTRFARARDFVAARGFRLVPGSLTGRRDAYRSGSIRARAEELNALLRDPGIRCVMSAIGGFNSNALLPHLDEDAIRRDPKIVVGYSDVTALLLGIHARTGLVTFHGPALVASLGELPPLVDRTWEAFAAVACVPRRDRHELVAPAEWTDEFIEWEEQSRPKLTRPNDVRFHGSGTVRGRLIGGNLNTMGGIGGTPWMPPIEPGDVLLLEDSRLSIATVERSLAWLDLARVFDRVGAVLLGKHELLDDAGSGRTTLDVLREILGDREVPVVEGFDSCHAHPMLTVPIGVPVEVNFDAERVTIVGPWLAE